MTELTTPPDEAAIDTARLLLSTQETAEITRDLLRLAMMTPSQRNQAAHLRGGIAAGLERAVVEAAREWVDARMVLDTAATLNALDALRDAVRALTASQQERA